MYMHSTAYTEKECCDFCCANIGFWVGAWTQTELCGAEVLVGINSNQKKGTFSEDYWTLKSGTFHRNVYNFIYVDAASLKNHAFWFAHFTLKREPRAIILWKQVCFE